MRRTRLAHDANDLHEHEIPRAASRGIIVPIPREARRQEEHGNNSNRKKKGKLFPPKFPIRCSAPIKIPAQEDLPNSLAGCME